jgi:hypothetical protein
MVAATGLILLDCAFAELIRPSSAGAMVMATLPKKRRRSGLMSSVIDLSPIGSESMLPRVACEDGAKTGAPSSSPISAVI